MGDQTITLGGQEYDAERIQDLLDAVKTDNGYEVTSDGALSFLAIPEGLWTKYTFVDYGTETIIDDVDVQEVERRIEDALEPDFETYLDDITPHYTSYITPPRFEDEVDTCIRQKEFSESRMRTYSDDDGVQIGPVFEHNGQACIGLIDDRD